jgi:hypothetical protein
MRVYLVFFLSVFCVSASLLAFPADASAQTAKAQAEAGYVLDVTGTWVLAGGPGNPLKLGQALTPGSAIMAKNPASNAAIAVMLRDGQVLGRKCSQQTCAQPLVIPSDIVPTSSIFADVSDWLSRITNDPKRYIGTMARGDQPKDAVILIQDGKADFAPALGNLDSEVFRLTLTPIGSSSKARSILRLRVKWDGKSGQSIDSTTLMPGLYEARFEDKNDSVWVLLAENKEYAGFERAFDQAVKQTEEWKDVSKQARMAFWRAELDRLASGNLSLGGNR